MVRPTHHVALLMAAVAWFCAYGCDYQSDPGAGGRLPITSANAPLVLREVNLGVIPRAGRAVAVTRLVNPTGQPLSWSSLGASCPCVSVVAHSNELQAHDDTFAKIFFDGSESPRFLGSVAVEVRALASDGAEVFRFDVRGEVVPEDELAFFAN